MIKTIKFLVHPHFSIKYYLYRDIKKIIKKYSFKGKILDVGCGEKPYRQLFKNSSRYVGIDFKNYSKNEVFTQEKPDFYFSKNYLKTLQLPFKSNSFDHVVSFQVLEHHKDPPKMISEMVRVVKKNGLIIITAPFIWGLHEEPHDYYRFTEYAFRYLLEVNSCKILYLKKQGGIASTISVLLNDALTEFANKNSFLYIISLCLYPFFLAISYVCFILDPLLPTKKIFLNYIVVAKKK